MIQFSQCCKSREARSTSRQTPPWTRGQATLSLLIVGQEAQYLVQDRGQQEAQFLARHMTHDDDEMIKPTRGIIPC